MNKIFKDTSLLLERLDEVNSNNDSKVGLCHGCFDLVHPGHLLHFKEAKKHCDILIVSVTSDKYINKGIGRPLFKEDTRLNFLAELESIDFVILSDSRTSNEMINALRPDFYFKGKDYDDSHEDISGQLKEEIDAVKSIGGKFFVTETEKLSSTSFINSVFSKNVWGKDEDFIKNLQETINYDSLKSYLELLKTSVEITVIGDIILDEYVYTQPLGTTTKSPVISALFRGNELMLGGGLAVARHLSDFFKRVHFIGIKGTKNWNFDYLCELLPENIDLHLFDADAYTPHKTKFLSTNYPTTLNYESKDASDLVIQKLFALSYLDEINISPLESEIIKVQEIIKNTNSLQVVMCDFGHGTINSAIWQELSTSKLKLIANIQTNSSNYGFNLANKYQDAFILCIDELEASLCIHPKTNDLNSRDLLKYLLINTQAKNAVVTRGKNGHCGIFNNSFFESPSLAKKVIDPVGAGDALLAGVALASFAQDDLITDYLKFIPSIFGAKACEIVGNRESISHDAFLSLAKPILDAN